MENNLIAYSLQPGEELTEYPYYLDLKSQQSYPMAYNPLFAPRVIDYNHAQYYYTNPPYFVNYPIQEEEVKIEEKTSPKQEKLKRKRTKFTKTQQVMLEEAFMEHDYIPKIKRMKLAKTLDLPDTQVKIWFQNRRCKNKKGKNTKKTVRNQEMLLENREFITNINNNADADENKTINFNESLNFSHEPMFFPDLFFNN